MDGTEQPSDIDVMKKMEDEHLRLQRQVRMTQTDRLNRAMGVHPQFRRQDQLMRTLKKEYINIIKDLRVAKSGGNKKQDKKLKVDLMKDITMRTYTENECVGGLTLMEKVEELLQRNNKQMLELRNQVNTNMGELEERRNRSESRLISTENKLETAMLRFNKVQCENKKIREEIEHMLQDRVIFNQAWTKMLNALTKGKKFLDDLFESSTLAYDQRDEWVIKLRSMQEKGKMEQMLQIHEMQDLQKAFDHEMKLYYFLGKKGVMRVNKEQEERDELEKIQEEEHLKKELDDHQKILYEINDYTEEANINKIIERFEATEQENFSIYKLLTDYCAENVALSRDVKKIRQTVDDRREWNIMMEERRQSKLNILEEQLQKKKKKTEELREEDEERKRQLQNTMENVHDIFKMLDCSLEPYQHLLGDKEPTLNHLDLTFRLINEKVKELVEITYYYERFIQKKATKTTSRLKKYTVNTELGGCWTPRPLSIMVHADPCPSCVEARWMSRVTEALEVPFDRTMLLNAISELANDPAFEKSDRIHPLIECRLPRSRAILAKRYMKN